MIDIVDRLSFDATRCEVSFSRGVASNIEEAVTYIKQLRAAAERVCAFDWSDNNDDDAVASVDELRRLLR